jgi:hypothetical protein
VARRGLLAQGLVRPFGIKCAAHPIKPRLLLPGVVAGGVVVSSCRVR